MAAQWVLNASLLMLAGFLVFGGRLGDAIGLRRVFVIGSILFAGASACAGLSPTFGVLLVFRVLQGLGGALMLPTSVAIVSHAYSGPERGGALGTMGGAAAVAGALGPVIGGGLTSLLGWRSVLLVNVPLAMLAVGAALFSAPSDSPARGSRQIDFLGTALLSVTIVCLVFGLSQSEVWGFTSPGVLVPLLVSVVAAPAFVLVESRVAYPLLELRLLLSHHNHLGATISQGIAAAAGDRLRGARTLRRLARRGRPHPQLLADLPGPASLRHRPGPRAHRERPGDARHPGRGERGAGVRSLGDRRNSSAALWASRSSTSSFTASMCMC